jgi:hypothetical protein
MKLIHTFAIYSLLGAPAFAQHDDAAFLGKFEKTFEQGGVVETAQFIPAAMMSGPLHKVGARAFNDGMHNTYFLHLDGSEIEVTTGPSLATRIREVYAIEALRRTSKSDAFGKSIASAGRQKVDSVAGIVRDPLGTVAAIPRGASRFFGRIGEGLKGGRSEGEDGVLKGITGVSKAKAQLAVKYGVSPYSTNEELQRELDAVARAMAAGNLAVSAATSAIGGPAGEVASIVGMNQALQETLINSTPSDLRIVNRKKLFALGVDRAHADEFLMHPWYSPWHATIVTDALTTLGANPNAFLNEARKALTPEDAVFFQRLAQILVRYHTTQAPLRTIRNERGVICALDRDGVLLVPLSCDYAVWAERAARRAEEFSALRSSRSDLKGLALWVDGALSERLSKELAERQIAARVNVLGALH